MPRNKCRRRVGINPEITCFKAQGVSKGNLGNISLELDEIESLRLKDLSEFNQEECARKMNVSTSTFQRIINSAHKKVAQALLGGKSITINKCIMPNRDGSGPQGQGSRTGRGMGNCGGAKGNGRRQEVDAPRQGAGQGGSCVCPKCGEKIAHTAGQPCYLQKCPKCAEAMIREA